MVCQFYESEWERKKEIDKALSPHDQIFPYVN